MDVTMNFDDICSIYTTKEFYGTTGEWKSKPELQKMFKDCTYRFSESGDIYVCKKGTKDFMAVINIQPVFLDKLLEVFIDDEI